MSKHGCDLVWEIASVETTDVNAWNLALSTPTKLTTPKCIRSHDGKLGYLDLSSRDYIASSDLARPGPRLASPSDL